MGSKLPIDAITSPHVSIRDGSLLTSITFASGMATPCLGSGEAQIDDIMQRKTTVPRRQNARPFRRPPRRSCRNPPHERKRLGKGAIAGHLASPTALGH